MKSVVITSNMLNEIDQLPGWFDFVERIADAGIVIVDGGSTDGTIEYAEKRGAIVIIDNIIQREGYGPARNHLRAVAKSNFPDAHWAAYFDADERILEKDFHRFRFIKDYLTEAYDVVAFPRIDWKDYTMIIAAKDWKVNPDWQARMTRLGSGLQYVRKLHEQLVGHRKIYTSLEAPKINHFHRLAGQEKRDFIGKVCAKLHREDSQFGETYPKHHKEEHYAQLLDKEGL